MTTPMTKTSWSWSERVSDTVPNGLMCWISCSDVCVTFYRLVYRQGDDQHVSSSTVDKTIIHRRCHQITKKRVDNLKWGNNVIFYQLPWAGFAGWTFGRSYKGLTTRGGSTGC
jgi:hypothetical protein